VVKLDVVGNRILLRPSTAAGAKEIMLRTDGTDVDLNARNADLFLHSITGDTIIQAFDGRVGIGTSAPASTLDVDGTIQFNAANADGNIDMDNYNILDTNVIDVSYIRDATDTFVDIQDNLHMSGRIYYNVDPTFRCNIPAVEFDLQNENEDDVWHRHVNGFAYASGTDGWMQIPIICPVHLPEDAYVREFRIYCYDNTAVDQLDISITLNRRSVTSLTPQAMASYNILAANSPNIQQFVDNTIVNPIIDNDNYQYYITAMYDQDSYSGTSMRFYGCRITYTTPVISPG
jgi:hypothetical protein